MSPHDVSFPSMGSETRIVLEGAEPGPARAFLEAFERRLTRFDPASELCALNASPLQSVPASALLRRAVRAALWAADRSGGLVDPTLLGALCAAGYDRSRRRPELALVDALQEAPSRAPAAPDANARWREIAVDDVAGVVRRPPGVSLDSGGTGKGLAADLAAASLAGAERFAIDCGGDLRVGGPAHASSPSTSWSATRSPAGSRMSSS